jgi:hypothetical protein
MARPWQPRPKEPTPGDDDDATTATDGTTDGEAKRTTAPAATAAAATGASTVPFDNWGEVKAEKGTDAFSVLIKLTFLLDDRW